jgi:alpha-beta hydrolase superfamily lysophospholipase
MFSNLRATLVWLAKKALFALVLVGVTLLAVRAYDSTRFPPLQPWHTYVPTEMSVAELDAGDWAGYLKAEERIFASVRAEVSQKLPPDEQTPINRYFEGSPIYTPHFERDWNRSYVLEPAGKPAGVAVFLHGLTDSPYSLRHMARHYRDKGYLTLAIRLPAHGTVPAGLTRVQWEDWMAATRLTVREARKRVPAGAPLHLVGFSNGGALAVKYTLDALEDPQLARPDRLVLISPMIGITRFARFAGLAGLPSLLPSFSKASWLGVVPEFNPFKYNSFPVNGARQSYRLTDTLQTQIARLSREGKLDRLPPIITFQSVIDYTVSTPAIVSALYQFLPANGSELVIFDVNRTVKFGPLLRPSAETAVTRLLPAPPLRYRVTIIGNAGPDSTATVARSIEVGETGERTRPLDLEYPLEIFSLSHVAVPFPLDDPLYGLHPDPNSKEQYGMHLGAWSARGERGALVVDQEFLSRIASNPFFPYILSRVSEGIDGTKPVPGVPSAAKVVSGGAEQVAAPPPEPVLVPQVAP